MINEERRARGERREEREREEKEERTGEKRRGEERTERKRGGILKSSGVALPVSRRFFTNFVASSNLH